MVGVAVNDPVAWLADLMELLTNGAKGVKAGERVVAGEVRRPCLRDKVLELPGEGFNLPGFTEEMMPRSPQ